MCDCFHLAFPNWHAAPSTGAGRRLKGPESDAEDNSIYEEPSQPLEEERPRPQGSSPVEEYPETEKRRDSYKEDPLPKGVTGKKSKRAGLGSLFDKRSTPKMSKLKGAHSPESEVTAKDGGAEGLVFTGGGKDGIFIKEVVPKSPASKNLSVKEGDQILSATVYFDNVSCEDAMQILEHAQAYKVKLCLKRKPDIRESEQVFPPEIINEEEASSPEMRGREKTKKQSGARISWPKFYSLGKGRKSQFTRSHSSSEADDQRKLELSPTSSNTESPVKFQEAFKVKKKHKVKLPGMRKTVSMSTSEEQDIDSLTAVPSNTVDAHQSQEALNIHSPEVCVTERPKVTETFDVRLDQNDDEKVAEPETKQHKVELIGLDNTLKTTDLTVALADKESPSSLKSPEKKKKKKKERSEFKLRILGKDKSQKQEKVKPSPKRLQTLGASIEKADSMKHEESPVIASVVSHTELEEHQKPTEASTQLTDDAKSVSVQAEMGVPKVDLSLDMSDTELLRKSPMQDIEKTQKGSLSVDVRQKADTKVSPTFKLPKIGFSDITTEETIPKRDVNVEFTSNIKHLNTEATAMTIDPYDRLSASGLSEMELPKREDIEIPGMEDLSSVTLTTQRNTEPKSFCVSQAEEIKSETVQMSIDVDSVKEAVSKLPGFKLPRVDMSGVPIPEEITMIDANAQRITMKTQATPTKVLDVRQKQEAYNIESDLQSSPEILSRTSVKLPKLKPADFGFQEPITDIQVYDKSIEQEDKAKVGGIKIKFKEFDDIIMPEKDSQQEEANLQAQDMRRTIEMEGNQSASEAVFITEQDKDTTENLVFHSPTGSDEKLTGAKITIPSFGVTKPDIRLPDIGIDLSRRKLSDKKSYKVDRAKVMEARDGLPKVDISLPEEEEETEKESKEPESRGKIKDVENEGQGGRFKLPKIGISMPKVKGPDTDLSLSSKIMDETLPEGKPEIQHPHIELKEPSGKVKIQSQMKDVQLKDSETFKQFDVTIGSEIDLGLKDGRITLPEAKAEVYLPDMELHKPSDEVLLKTPTTKVKEVEKSPSKLKFKMPTFERPKPTEIDLSLLKEGVDIALPEDKAEVKHPDFDLNKASMGIDASKIEVPVKEVEVSPSKSKIKMPTLQLSHFGAATLDGSLEIPINNKETKIDGDEQTISEGGAAVDITTPSVKVKVPSIEVKSAEYEIRGKRGEFKMQNLGISTPKVKAPETDLNILKTLTDVTLPEAKAEAKLPDVEVKAPLFDVSAPAAPTVDADTQLKGVEKSPSKSKFKMPKFGIALPQVKGPEIDLSLSKKDVDITLPSVKVEVLAPDVDVKAHSTSAEVKAPEIEVQIKDVDESPSKSKFKMPTFKMPHFGAATPTVIAEAPDADKDITIDGAKLKTSRGVEVDVMTSSVEVEGTSIDVKSAEFEIEGKGGKFKMPNLGISMPKIKAPETDLSSSKKDTDITLPEAKAELKLPDVEVKEPVCDVSVPDMPTVDVEAKLKKSSWSLPKFSFSKPSVKAPDSDVKLDGQEVEVTLPEAKTEVHLPDVDVEVKGPSAAISIDKQPEAELEAKPKKSRISLPRFSFSKPSVKEPVVDVDLSHVEASVPEMEIEVKQPEVEIKQPEVDIELDSDGSKFTMPNFGISLPKVKGTIINSGLSKKGEDITIPEDKAEIKLPHVDVSKPYVGVDLEAPDIKVQVKDIQKSPSKSKFKLPTFKLPHFGPTIPTATSEIPEVNKEMTIDGAELDISSGAAVDFTSPSVEVEAPSIDVKSAEYEIEGKGEKFKMPNLDISIPKVKAPEIDLSLSNKDVDITLPSVKAQVLTPAVDIKAHSTSAEVKAPEIDVQVKDVEESPSKSKFKMPTFTMPHLGAATPTVTAEVPDAEKDITIDGAELNISKRAAVDVMTSSVEVEGTSIDLKSAEYEVEGKEGKFKMPHLGISMPKIKAPEIDLSLSKKDTDITLPEAKAELRLPDAEIKESVCDVAVPDMPTVDVEAKLKKSSWSLPRFSFSKPSVKGPDSDVKLDSQEVEVTLPEVKTEVHLPDVEGKGQSDAISMDKPPKAELEAKPKKSRFSLPRFSFSRPSVKEAEIDVDLSHVEASVPEMEIEVKQPEVEIEKPEIDEHEHHGGKLTMPKFGMSLPKVKGPEMDFSLSNKGEDIALPEAKAEVRLPGVDLNEPSMEVDVNAPDIEVQVKDIQGSSSKSKSKMLEFNLPHFGAATPTDTAEVPHWNKEITIDVAELKIPGGAAVDVTTSSVEIGYPSIAVKSTEYEIEGKGGEFQMQNLGIALPQVTRPDMDLSFSKKDADITLPSVKAEVLAPEIDIKIPSTSVEVKAPEIDIQVKEVEESPSKSKFKMPTFKMPHFGAATPTVTAEVPDAEKDLSIDGANVSEIEGKGGKFKMPNLGISMPKIKAPETDLSLSEKDTDITLPEAKAEFKLPDVEVKEPVCDVAVPDMPTVDVEAKLKKSSWSLPRFSFSKPSVKGPDSDVKLEGLEVEVTLPEAKTEVHPPNVEVKGPSATISTDKQPDVDLETKLKKPRFSLPRFSFSKPSVKEPEVDVDTPHAEASVPEMKAEVKQPELEIENPEFDGHGGKLKMPKFGISLPKVKEPEIDLGLSKRGEEITIPEAEAEVKFPDVGLNEYSMGVNVNAPDIEVQVKDFQESPSKSKFKMPAFKATIPTVSADVPEMNKEITIDGAELKGHDGEAAVNVITPSVEVELPSIDVKSAGFETDRIGGKFEIPNLGISIPKVKAPEIDLSLSKKNTDITLPSVKAEVLAPDVDIKTPSTSAEVKAPKIEDVEKSPSKSKFKMPTFNLPHFGTATPTVTAEVPDAEKDITIDGAELKISKRAAVDVMTSNVEVEGTSIDVKSAEYEIEGKGGKFKMPHLGISMPKMKAPETDLSLSKKEVEVEVKEPVCDVSVADMPAVDVEAKLKKSSWSLPRFSFSKPSVKGPDSDVNLDGQEVEVTLPEAKTVVHLPDVEGKGRSAAISVDKQSEADLEAKLKKPRFSLPRFSFSKPSVTEPEVDVDVEASVPEMKVEVKQPEVETDELEGHGGKFKMPKFGISLPKVKGPEIDLRSTMKEEDITVPKAKAKFDFPSKDGKATDIEVPVKDVQESPSKSKFKMPKFGIALPQVKGPETDLSSTRKDEDITLPKAKAKFDFPSKDGKATDIEVQVKDVQESPSKSKFKMPKFGIALPQLKGPEIDLSSSRKDEDITLPKAKFDFPSKDGKATDIEVQVKDVQESPSKSKFKMPKFGITLPQVKGPEIDLSLSKKDVDITVPSVKAQVLAPDVDIKAHSTSAKVKAPEIDVQVKDVEVSPSKSKFKMPTFNLPHFGTATPTVTAEVPEAEKDITIDGAELKISKRAAADVKTPSVAVEVPSIDVKSAEYEIEGKGGKFQMPNLGILMPKIKAPEIDLSLSKKDTDITLPEAKAELKLAKVQEPVCDVSVPDAPTVDVEAKLKKSSWSLPKFSFSKPSVKAPDSDVTLEGPEVDVTLPETKTEVHLSNVGIKGSSTAISMDKEPDVDLEAKLKKPRFSLPRFSFSKPSDKGPEVDVDIPHVEASVPEMKVEVKQTEVEIKQPELEVEHDVHAGKFKMPKFGISLPKGKEPDADLSLSVKGVDITLPEAQAEVTDVALNEPSKGVDFKVPETEVQVKDVEESPSKSKFKMPTIKLPNFGAATPTVTAEVPEVDKEFTVDGAEFKISKGGALEDIKTPSAETEVPSINVKSAGFESDGKGGTSKIPNLGISIAKVKVPEIDLSLSKNDTEITLSGAEAELKRPHVEVNEPPSDVSVPDAATVDNDAKLKKPSWSLPRFSFSKPSVRASDVSIHLEGPEGDVTLPEATKEVHLAEVEVKEPLGAISIEESPTIDLEDKLKKPRFSLPRLSFSFSKPSVTEPEVHVNVAKLNDSLPEGEVAVKHPEAGPRCEIEVKDTEGPPLQLSKFANVTVEIPEMDKDINTVEAEMEISNVGDTVDVKAGGVDLKSDVSQINHAESTESNLLGSPSKFKMPSFKMPRLSFSKPKAEDEQAPADIEHEVNKLEIGVETQVSRKSPVLALTSFSEILKTIDVEFNVPTVEEVEQKLTPSKEEKATTGPDEFCAQPTVETQHTQKEAETTEVRNKSKFKLSGLSFGWSSEKTVTFAETTGNMKQFNEKETTIKQESAKSPERVGWLKFPKFGLSSPSEPANITEKVDHKSEKSPVGDTMEDLSTTCSVRSSDDFADISSTVTSEQVGFSLSSPTKVMVKYSDPNATVGLGEVHGDIITSTTRTELISVEPNLPERITIMSSGVSSSSIDTLRLESENIHVITSNIQATPETQHAKLLTEFQVETAEGPSPRSEDSYKTQSGIGELVERHVGREMSSDSRETVAIASSIQRLKDSVHSEKMKFFDSAKK